MARDGERGRGDWKARRGSRNSGPYAESSGDTGPVDIAAVRRDDALIDAISGDGPVSTDSAEEYQLATLLASWRAELIADPLPSAPDLDAIVAAVNQEIGARQVRMHTHTRGNLRLLRPIAGAAAALALVIGGLTAFSYSAGPGDPLWRVKEVVFSEQAQSTVVQRAGDDMAEAQTMLAGGADPDQIRTKLDTARRNATQVNDSAKQDELAQRFNALIDQLRRVSPEAARQVQTIATTAPRPGGDQQPSTGSSGSGTGTGTTNPGTDGNSGTTSGQPSTTASDTGNTTPAEPSTGGKPSTGPTSGRPSNPPTTPPPTTGNEPSSANPPPTVVVPTTVASPTVVEPTTGGPPPVKPSVSVSSGTGGSVGKHSGN
ncbi:hypothetical protein D5S18_23745 [Nocardia panacis]|uniref:Anti-sigma-D factor RsdA sigma factor binding region domain-containing protein n=1 Tax=Nocardia panacis TaxID=2340916 RepID=A0A3A4JYD0_9NOCA|nr:anti-sigma-D factor RsdA [Nocardia panacis]RJO72183.1 hypothetical protein D5S18_23745 [Nocardia panacis]